MEKRKLPVVVISDIHLGTFACKDDALCRYLSTIDPQILILNGDIIDDCRLSKKYWPDSHMLVIKQIASMLSRGVKVYYLTGNHDRKLKQFEDFSLGNFHVASKYVHMHEDGLKSLFFHGDILDINKHFGKWLIRFGHVGFKILVKLNILNYFLHRKTGIQKISISKKIKKSPKHAVELLHRFEHTVSEFAILHKYKNVICGHSHHPKKSMIRNNRGAVTYLNSGDWVENLTALEYVNEEWNIYYYKKDILVNEMNDSFYLDEAAYLQTTELFRMLLKDFDKAS